MNRFSASIAWLVLALATQAHADSPLLPIPSPLSAAANGGGGSVAGAVTGSGASPRVAFWTGASTLGSDTNFNFVTGSQTLQNGGVITVQAGVTPIVWLEKDTAGQVLMAFMNTTAAGSTEIEMGQARDASDGNYADWSNLNSGYVADGLFTAGSAVFGQNSSLSGAKMVIYTQGNFGGTGAPIVFATNGHLAVNERARVSDTGLNLPRGVLSVNIDARTQPQPAPFYSSTNTSDFGGVFANALATNGGFVDTVNDTGDSTYIGTTGSTGFAVAGSTRAKFGLIQSNTPGGFILNEFANASMLFATNNTVRLTIDNAGTNMTTAMTNIIPTTDNTGNIGTNANRYATVRAVAVTTGDLVMDARPERDAVWRLIEEDNRIVAVNEVTGEHFHIVMERE